MVGLLVSDEWERIWEESIVAYLRCICLKGLTERPTNFKYDSQRSGIYEIQPLHNFSAILLKAL
jgi:hypothetical protein